VRVATFFELSGILSGSRASIQAIATLRRLGPPD
jgi:hypothetical protein